MVECVVYLDSERAYLRARQKRPWKTPFEQLVCARRDALASILEQAKSEASARRGEIRALLGTSLCHFECIEGLEDVWRLPDLEAIAKRRFEDRVGVTEVADMKISTERVWDDRVLACAVPTAVLRELEFAASNCQIRLASVQPWLGASLRRLRHRLAQRSAVAVEEPDCISLVWEVERSLHIESLPLLQKQAAGEQLKLLLTSVDCDEKIFTHLLLQARLHEGQEGLDDAFADSVEISNLAQA
jgi:hypothetical protein